MVIWKVEGDYLFGHMKEKRVFDKNIEADNLKKKVKLSEGQAGGSITKLINDDDKSLTMDCDYNVPVANQFSNLSADNDVTDAIADSDTVTNADNTAANPFVMDMNEKITINKPMKPKIIRIPPIFVENGNIRNLMVAAKESNIINDLSIVSRGGSIRAIVRAKTIEAHRKFFELIKIHKVEAHTYTYSENKNKTLVLKGVHHSFNVEDVLVDLKNQMPHINIISCKKLISRKDRAELNIFIVSFANNVEIKEILNCKTVLYHRVKWEGLRKKEIVQCLNCRLFGHVAINCTKKYRCKNCNEEHEPKKCFKPVNEKPYCINCKEYGHPASFRGCKFYRKYIEILRNQRLERMNKNQQAIQTTLANMYRVDNKSYSDVTKNFKNNNTENTSASDVGAISSFMTNEAQNLFGCSLFTLINKINQFLPKYKLITKKEEKQENYLRFIFEICSGGK